MSNDDIEKVYSFLDSKNRGKINYNDFCKLVQKKKDIKPIGEKLNQDQDFENQLKKNLANEKAQEIRRIEQDKLERMSNASNFYTGLKAGRGNSGMPKSISTRAQSQKATNKLLAAFQPYG